MLLFLEILKTILTLLFLPCPFFVCSKWYGNVLVKFIEYQKVQRGKASSQMPYFQVSNIKSQCTNFV